MKLLAYYLPQFHPIPENDEWWGRGFTEWVNVRRARPLFEGHDHPRVPSDLGEYDLTDPEVHVAQTELARKYGIDAFCMYFYWFDGVRLLEKPLDAWRGNPDLLPYCLSWANEPWTRRWNGRNQDVLMPQTYPERFAERIFGELLPHLRAPHYLRVDDKPVLVVHRADLIPDPTAFSSTVRDLATAAGLAGLYMVAAETTPEIDPTALGFDAAAEFPPVGVNRLRNAVRRPLVGLDPAFRGRLVSYERVVQHYLSRPRPSFVRHRGVMPSWDNSARRGAKATVYLGHSPRAYQRWLKEALDSEKSASHDHPMVFINAWNEWAEGAYLEPDRTHGHRNLEATAAARNGELPSAARPDDREEPRGAWSRAHLRSLALLAAGGALARARAVRNRSTAWRRR